jgi:hypothetical protein
MLLSRRLAQVADLQVFASSLDIGCGPSVPGLESVRIVLSHLLLGARDRLKEQVSETAEDMRHKVSPQHIKLEVSDYGSRLGGPQQGRCGNLRTALTKFSRTT